MKISKRQHRRIIKEEKARLREGRMKEMEMQIMDEIVDLRIERGAVRFSGEFSDDVYQDALDQVGDAVVPTLSSMAARGAYARQ